jgi:hypothetical protein
VDVVEGTAAPSDGKLATVLEVEPVELLRVPSASKDNPDGPMIELALSRDRLWRPNAPS